MSINDAIGPAILGGGGASLPTADPAAVRAGGTPNTVSGLDGSGDGVDRTVSGTLDLVSSTRGVMLVRGNGGAGFGTGIGGNGGNGGAGGRYSVVNVGAGTVAQNHSSVSTAGSAGSAGSGVTGGSGGAGNSQTYSL